MQAEKHCLQSTVTFRASENQLSLLCTSAAAADRTPAAAAAAEVHKEAKKSYSELT